MMSCMNILGSKEVITEMFIVEVYEIMTENGDFIGFDQSTPIVVGKNLTEDDVKELVSSYAGQYTDPDDFKKIIPEGESTYVMVLGPGIRRRKLFVRRMGA